MKLNILISTHNEKVANLSSLLLPEREDVSYIVSYQYANEQMLADIPEDIKRKDVKIIPIQGIGLSRNRNNALKYADGDIALIADDDVAYTDEYLDKIIEVFTKNPQTDIALFKIKTRDTDPPMKRYPLAKCKYKALKGYYPSSIEMAMRVAKVKDKIFFDERFGLGSEYLDRGEEDIFIRDCINKSLQVDFYPYYIVEHPYQSTGKNHLTQKSLRTRGAVSSYIYGILAYIRMIKFSLFMALRGRSNIYTLLKNTIWGVMYERRTRQKYRSNE
ncbi:MAG: glycosyltransferase [Bacteroidales bacterium]|nr:glycosyltransferase [Bacteroidales bacterium]